MKGKKFSLLGFDTAIVASFRFHFHSRSTVMASFMWRNLELQNQISQELEEVFTNGHLCSSPFRWLFHLRPT